VAISLKKHFTESHFIANGREAKLGQEIFYTFKEMLFGENVIFSLLFCEIGKSVYDH